MRRSGPVGWISPRLVSTTPLSILQSSNPSLRVLPTAAEQRQSAECAEVVRIHGYNVPLSSVKEEYHQAERTFRDNACRLTDSPPDDYLLFVHYAWPPERIGAGGPFR
ncbi:hypothetical protein [Synechococcus sp. ROS8604]|uniref:hypothetical protein n=1 Tax=Synechococcus sp. ROS8604 TaxID=1442557 RepID=UPI0016463B22|nr:hypothetical protein [Synechococcus sp. ROS8604]